MRERLKVGGLFLFSTWKAAERPTALGRHKNPRERAQILNSPRWGVDYLSKLPHKSQEAEFLFFSPKIQIWIFCTQNRLKSQFYKIIHIRTTSVGPCDLICSRGWRKRARADRKTYAWAIGGWMDRTSDPHKLADLNMNRKKIARTPLWEGKRGNLFFAITFCSIHPLAAYESRKQLNDSYHSIRLFESHKQFHILKTTEHKWPFQNKAACFWCLLHMVGKMTSLPRQKTKKIVIAHPEGQN